MILNGEDWHHLAVAKLPSLLWEVTSKIRFTQKLAKNKNYCEVKNHCSFTVKIEVQHIIVNVI